jgi:hypothetical protein
LPEQVERTAFIESSTELLAWSLREWATLPTRRLRSYQTQQGVDLMSDTGPIAWRGVVYGTPVTTVDGVRVGTIREVLGSDSEDIFHGLRVGLSGGHRDVMVPAGNVTSMSTAEVGLDMSRSAVEELPTYDEVATYHLASVGWLRKHLGWTKDSTSDEEPG